MFPGGAQCETSKGYLSLALPQSERKNSRYILRIAKPLVDDVEDTSEAQRILLREDTLNGTRYIAFEEHTRLEEFSSRYRRSDGLFRFFYPLLPPLLY